MQELIRFDELSDNVYYILEKNNHVLNCFVVDQGDSANKLNKRVHSWKEWAQIEIQAQFIRGYFESMNGVTETIIHTCNPEARKSDRYRMILTRCPDEWLEEDEIREWLG